MVKVSDILCEIRDPDYNPQKFKQVLHYFIDETSSFDNIGKKALFKLLYFNDFDYYELFEEKLTGEVYAKLQHGPAPRHFNDIIKELKEEGKIEEKRTAYFGKPQIRYISLTRPYISFLNAQELEHMEETICRYGKMNGSRIEALSHEDIPWKSADMNKNLDYEVVFYRSPEMSVREYPDD